MQERINFLAGFLLISFLVWSLISEDGGPGATPQPPTPAFMIAKALK